MGGGGNCTTNLRHPPLDDTFSSKSVLSRISNIEEAIIILVILVEAREFGS